MTPWMKKHEKKLDATITICVWITAMGSIASFVLLYMGCKR